MEFKELRLEHKGNVVCAFINGTKVFSRALPCLLTCQVLPEDVERHTPPVAEPAPAKKKAAKKKPEATTSESE